MRLLRVLSALALISCSASPKPPFDAANRVVEPPPGQPDLAASSDRDQAATVAISKKIREACGISASEAYFAYNSAALRTHDDEVLTKLARCFVDGPLSGRRMALIGHADSRGEEEYNLVLGEHRAGSVQRALVSRNVKPAQIDTVSRGELDATGTDEPSWALDRRVDVELVEE